MLIPAGGAITAGALHPAALRLLGTTALETGGGTGALRGLGADLAHVKGAAVGADLVGHEHSAAIDQTDFAPSLEAMAGLE